MEIWGLPTCTLYVFDGDTNVYNSPGVHIISDLLPWIMGEVVSHRFAWPSCKALLPGILFGVLQTLNISAPFRDLRNKHRVVL